MITSVARPPYRESGVTLIEALVVLTIVGVAGAWSRSCRSTPTGSGRALETTAGDIRNFLQQAFTESVNQHTPVTVTLQQDAATGRWVLQLNPPPPAAAHAERHATRCRTS